MSETKKVNYKRETAKRELVKLIGRVKELNSDANALLHVTDLIIFGSYLKNTPTVHDLDVFVAFKRTNAYDTIVNRDYKGNAGQFYADYAYKSGRHFHNITEELTWWQEEHYRRVKGSSRVLSLHDMWEFRRLNLTGDEYVSIMVNGVWDEAAIKPLIIN